MAGGATLVIVFLAAATVLALTSIGGGASAAERKADACRDALDDGRYSRAVGLCTEAIELDSQRVLPFTYRAIAHVRLGNFQDALDDAGEALDLDREAGDAHAVHARAVLRTGDRTAAEADMQRAADLRPETAAGHLILAETYRGLGRLAEAQDSADEACDLGLSEACDFSAVPTRDEAIDLLPQMSLATDDLPADLLLIETGLFSLDEESLRGGLDPASYRRQLESWAFVLGHERYFFADPTTSLFDVFSVTWLHESEEDAEDAFLDGAFYGPGGETTGEDEVILLDAFSRLGDESEAYLITGPYPLGPEETIDTDTYLAVIRHGPFMSLLTATWPSGRGSEREFRDLAEVVASRMIGSSE
jgi:tetratricopeptide (TPR) repeat protein